MQEPRDLVRLRQLFADAPLAELDERVGLLLHRLLSGPAYDQTPRNCVTFASTGGNGVHFSFMSDAGEIDDTSPVVLTVPLAARPNRIVGRNLRHFVGLGRPRGYFVLEQLQYDFAESMALLGRMDLQRNDSDAYQALCSVADALGAPVWQDYSGELKALQDDLAERMDVSEGI